MIFIVTMMNLAIRISSCHLVLQLHQQAGSGKERNVLVTRVFSGSSDQLVTLKLGDELNGDAVLLWVTAGIRNNNVDFFGVGGDNLGLLASIGLEEDGSTPGLLNDDVVQGAVGLQLNLLGVDHLNVGNDTNTKKISVCFFVDLQSDEYFYMANAVLTHRR